jgi:Eukaryotic aspartyl protease
MSVSTASTGPQTIPLQGGLLHASGFIVESHVGGQAFHLQVDVSQGALTIPEVGCSTCRLGDRRYDYMKSTSKGHPVPCDDTLCDRNTCVAGAPGACPVCASGGRCCVPAPGSSEPTGPFSAADAKDAACVFNLKFSDGMAGNGTMYEDSVVLGGATLPKVLFGAMREETGSFEVAYADGILGLGFQKSGRHPSRTPALMSYFANATGLPSVFTMCVSRFGGSLVLGAADKALTKGGADFKYVPLLNVMESDKYVVKVQGRGMVGDVEVQLPELASGVWSSATRSIAVGKTTFLAILETLMEHHCDIPGLCSVNSWFRQQSCHALEDSDFKKMPTLTFYIGDDLPIVLQPEDYLLAYKEVQGKLYRCVAFIVTDLLQERGYGILLGALIMQRYAVVYDMKEERIGVAEADMSKCGPPNGTTAGLSASSLGFQAPEHKNILTADAPAASLIGEAGSTLSVEFEQSEACRAIPGCSICARNSNCSYSYNDGKCVSLAKAGSKPYPYCSGASCFCVAVGETGWYVGLVVGVVLALVTSASCFCAYHRRRRKLRYQAIVPFESSENEVEVFG